MGPVLENQWRRQYVGYFYFLFRLYIFFIFLNFSYWPTFIFRPKSSIQPGTTETSPI